MIFTKGHHIGHNEEHHWVAKNTLHCLARKLIHLPIICTRAIALAIMKSTNRWLKKEEEEEDPSFFLLVVVVVLVVSINKKNSCFVHLTKLEH